MTKARSNATAPAAKGEIVVGTGTDASGTLSVGNAGETLVADSSISTGLRWGNNYGFTAGKNCIINGDFRINQRSFTSTTSGLAFGFDRWLIVQNSTATYSAQTFTPGTAPVAGYEAINFARIANTTTSASNEYVLLQQRIEDVRTLAGKTVTISFWAKAASGTPKVGVEMYQGFGSGGSADVSIAGTAVTISTTWTRYSVVANVTSVSGKTIGTGSYTETNLWTSAGSSFNTRSGSVGNQTATIDIWGVQVEQGSVATAFQTATGTLAGELAACQRYYYRATANANYAMMAHGQASSSTHAAIAVRLPVTMRTAPTVVDYSTLRLSDESVGYAVTNLTINTYCYSKDIPVVDATVASGLTAQRYFSLQANNSTSAYLGLAAEL